MKAQIDGNTHQGARLGANMEKEALCELVEKAIAGDKAAFAQLYKLKSTHILYQAQQIMKSRADAEDVSQHVALRMYQRIGDLRDPKLFSLWLRRIIVNECMRSMKKRRTWSDQLNIDDFENRFLEEQEEFLPAEFSEKQELRQQLIEIVHALPPRQQEAILLYYYEDMSTAEIAGAMGISQNTVFATLDKARKWIKKELEKKTGRLIDKTYSIGSLAGITVLKAVFNYDAQQTVAEESINAFMQTCYRIIESGGASMALASSALPAAQLAWSAKLTGILATGIVAAFLAVAIASNPVFQPSTAQPYVPNSSSINGSMEDPQPSVPAPAGEDLDIPDPQGQPPEDQQPGGEGVGPPVGTSPTPDANDEDRENKDDRPPAGGPKPTPVQTPQVAYISSTIVGNVVLVDSSGTSLSYSGNLLSDLQILLKGSEGQTVAQALTGVNGGFSFENIRLEKGGAYRLQVGAGQRMDISQANDPRNAAPLRAAVDGDTINRQIYVQPAQAAPGTILLLGSNDEEKSINPASALFTDFSALDSAVSWSIHSAISGTMLYSGSGALVEDAFTQMAQDAPEDLYFIEFTHSDAAGTTSCFRKDFTISRGG